MTEIVMVVMGVTESDRNRYGGGDGGDRVMVVVMGVIEMEMVA